jgi:peptidyl-prolyl cis-trans isomerase C
VDWRWLALGAVGLAACRSPVSSSAPGGAAASWAVENAPDLGPVVARVGQSPVFAAEVRAQSQRSGKPPREALDELIRFQLLAERARTRGIAPPVAGDPASRALLVQRLIEREFEPSVDPGQLSEQELRSVYEKARTTFVHPRLVRVALLSVYPRRGLAKEVALQRARETAFALFDFVSKRPERGEEDFFTIQQQPQWLSRKVHFTRIWQGPDESFGPLRAREGAAIARLLEPGDTTPLLEDHGAYHIARYIEERPARNLSFEQARDELRRDYYPRWRRERFERFAGQLTDAHRIETFSDRVLAAPAR